MRNELVDYSKIPKRTLDGLKRWINYGIWPGHFLTNLLDGKIARAMNVVDDRNFEALPHILAWLTREAPSVSWGDLPTCQFWHSGLSSVRQKYLRDRERKREKKGGN